MADPRRYFDYRPRRVNYLTHISQKNRCVFVEVPKAGCSVVKRVLQYSEVEGRGIDPDASVTTDRSRRWRRRSTAGSI